mmetsp:Transcript_96551/g.251621  ORF Transcript_96551/g.251621 Transcript_96551/m.251621 type:complete len:356 (-) Transcript_96551:583-1650(-)
MADLHVHTWRTTQPLRLRPGPTPPKRSRQEMRCHKAATSGLWFRACCGNSCSRRAAHVVADTRDTGFLARGWKFDAHTVLEYHRLVFVGDHGMHHRAAAVALDVRLVALVGATPTHEAFLPAWKRPIGVPIEGAPEPRYNAGRVQVDECIAEGGVSPEVDGKVDEVVLSSKTLAVHHIEEHLSAVVVGQIAEHHRRTILELHVSDFVIFQHVALSIHPALNVRRRHKSAETFAAAAAAAAPHLHRAGFAIKRLLLALRRLSLGGSCAVGNWHVAPCHLSGHLDLAGHLRSHHERHPNHALLSGHKVHLVRSILIPGVVALNRVGPNLVGNGHGRWYLCHVDFPHALLLQPLVLQG